MAILYSRAPTRISFAGGGTDVPAIAKRIGGCVTSVAISRYVYATLESRSDKKISMRSIKFDGSELRVTADTSLMRYDGRLDLIKSVVEELGQGCGFDITVISEVPEHSGLGASASAYAALIALFDARYKLCMTKKDIAELSFRLETEKLKNNVGKQDQYAACYGGLNFIRFSKKMDVTVSPIKTNTETLMHLEKNLALLYTVKRQKSAGAVIRKQAERFSKGGDALRGFLATKELGEQACRALRKNDLGEFGKIMGLVWEHKKKFSPETTNPLIERMHKTAVQNGAYGGKISGAGGGGCGFWFCKDGKKNRVVAELEKLGAKTLNFKFDFEGVKTWKP